MLRALLAVTSVLLAAAAPAGAQQRNCGWSAEVSGSQINAAYPDEAATYWLALAPIPPGGHVELRGRFPYARYASFHTYDRQLSAIDALADVEIAPEPGSVNPFVEGAPRLGDARDYVVRMVGERKPVGTRAPGTIYTENEDGSKSTIGFGGGGIVLRVYEPNRGLDAKGGVPLPTLTLVSASGERTVLPECPEARLPDAGQTDLIATLGLGGELARNDLRGSDPPVWRKHRNALNSTGTGNLETPVTGDLAAAFDAATREGASGGLAENSHNKYIFTTFERTLGEVAVFRFKLPTTPRTLDAEPIMGSGQLRYASFCTNIQTTAFLSCRNDDAIALDARGYATVAVSSAASRPSNAREGCGITWLPTGPAQAVLIVRHMLPTPGFANAIQLADIGTEEAVLGEGYPRGRYYASAAQVERELGCVAPAVPAVTRGCGIDRRAPVARRIRIRTDGRRLRLRGRAADLGCSRVAEVAVAVARRLPSGGCRFLSARGRLRARRSCRRPAFVVVRGTRRWQLRTRPQLPRGRYALRTRVVDGAGNVSRRRPVRFAVR